MSQLVRVGDVFEHRGVKVRVLEVLPYFSITGRKYVQVAYEMVEGKGHNAFVSATAHWWQSKAEDARKYVERIIDNYLKVGKPLRLAKP